ncbi:TIM barrel protein [Paenibacillus hexagrammi]|uniref:TIM barrel protein n=1 Tax=Paenibacillus hexagrammi TaxID=2908839 RepID=A0ABY3SEQ0_9BACL|nr:TIM barrel protein [Paenibacillus sp. YPD9-1]UJF31910.1 TIM barrel protein [Paenibacillus sp. YPD9-1]
MKYSICIGAYPGKDAVYHLEKIKEHDLQGLELYQWWNLGDLRTFAAEQQRIGKGIIATCTKVFNLVDPAFREAYVEGLRETIAACRMLHISSIITQTGSELPGIPREVQREAMIETLKRCAPLLEEANIVLEIEPLNGLVDHPGHFLQRSDESAAVIEAVGSRHVKLVFDVYHQQITEGNVIRNLTAYKEHIHHYHIADNPGRNEPGTGELNYIPILKAIQQTGFDGYVGLECKYSMDTDVAIEQFKERIASNI